MSKNDVVKMIVFSAILLLAFPVHAGHGDKSDDPQKNYVRSRHPHPHPHRHRQRNSDNYNKSALPAPPCFNSRVVDGHVYYYCDSFFYRKFSDGYRAVPAPQGATVSKLPLGCRSFILEGKISHKCDGSYYQSTQTGYKVVPRPNMSRTEEPDF